MAEVIIHPHPDIDAVTCIALAGIEVGEVHFIPAGIQELPKICPCCGKPLTGQERILDHPLGQKGRLDADGTRHAAASSMIEADDTDPKIIAEVDEQDSTGHVQTPRFCLPTILSAVRTEASERGLRGIDLDREVAKVMSRIISGLNLIYKARKRSEQIINGGVRIVEAANFKIAVLPQGEVSPQMGIVLNNQYNVSGHIYAHEYNIGIARYPGKTEPDLRKLSAYLPDWFIHTSGFLACWGSRKSPATKLPPDGTPQNQEELLALIQKVFGHSEGGNNE